MVEIADDRRPAVGLDRPPEALVEVGLAAVGRHRQLAGERQAVEAEPVDELDLEVVPGDRPSARSRPGAAIGITCADRVGPGEGHLERDHPAERAAERQVEPLDPERIEQRATGRAPGRGSRPPGSAAPYGRPVADRSRSGRSSRSGRRAGWRTRTPTRSVSSARPGPMSGSHQSPAASAEPVRAWMTRTCGADARRRTVVAVGDGQLGQRRPVVQLEAARAGRDLEPAGPGRWPVGLDRLGPRPRRGPVVAVEASSRPRRRARRRPTRRRSRRQAPARGRRSGRRRARADRQPDEVLGRAGRDLLLGRQLRVGRRGRMDDQRLGVADVGQQREDLDVVDEPPTGLDAALTPKVTIPPKPPVRYCLASLCDGCDSRPG